jgi:hypothetical protein
MFPLAVSFVGPLLKKGHAKAKAKINKAPQAKKEAEPIPLAEPHAKALAKFAKARQARKEAEP